MNIEEIIERLSQSMERYESETFRNSALSNLTPAQIHYIDSIYHLEKPRVSELASYLNVSKPTVTFAVDKMEKQKYVKKIQSDEDRRAYFIHLTAKGMELAELHDEIHKGYASFFRRSLSKKELLNLEKLLEKTLHEIDF